MMRSKYTIIALGAAAMIAVTVGIASANKYSSAPEIQGSADLAAVIENFIKENRKVSFESASKVAEASSTNVIVIDGRFTVMQGYLVYTFRVLDLERDEAYSMVIDAGNGSVLYTSEPRTFRSSNYENASIAVSMSSAAASATKEVTGNATVELGKLRIDSSGDARYNFIVSSEGVLYRVGVDAKDGSILDVVELGSSKGWYYGHLHRGYNDGWKERGWKYEWRMNSR